MAAFKYSAGVANVHSLLMHNGNNALHQFLKLKVEFGTHSSSLKSNNLALPVSGNEELSVANFSSEKISREESPSLDASEAGFDRGYTNQKAFAGR